MSDPDSGGPDAFIASNHRFGLKSVMIPKEFYCRVVWAVYSRYSFVTLTIYQWQWYQTYGMYHYTFRIDIL
jgi:hypothetical protein